MALNNLSVAFLIVNALALMLVPRRWAMLPLLLGACYMTLSQGILIGSLHFPVIRLLIAVGIVRVLVRGERIESGLLGLDVLVLVWSAWNLFSGLFHEPDPFLPSPIIFRMGVVYNVCGIYFLARTFCQSFEDVVALMKMIAMALVPLAIAMTYEKLAAHNLYSVLGGVPEVPQIRQGSVRAQGPFAHPILAGTVGAVLLPLMIALWRSHRKEGLAGVIACLAIVFCSASSGPVVSAIGGAVALTMWRFRQRMRVVQWSVVALYLWLDLLMDAPAYFLLARIDISGGSTGWHRAELIQSGLQHIDEWWLLGTDHTRHWMPTGVSWNPNHTDITNQYLGMGVTGGLPLMLIYILMLAKAFAYVGKIVRLNDPSSRGAHYLAWAMGASLFAHAATGLSVSYFDQSIAFLYVLLGAIGGLWAGVKSEAATGRMKGTPALGLGVRQITGGAGGVVRLGTESAAARPSSKLAARRSGE